MNMGNVALLLARQQIPLAVDRSIVENSQSSFKSVEGAKPIASQTATESQEPSFLDHFTNFFTRIIKAIKNHSIRSEFNSRAENATNDFFKTLKDCSIDGAGSAADKLDSTLDNICEGINACDKDLAQETITKIKASIDKATSKFSDHFINSSDEVDSARQRRNLKVVHNRSKKTDETLTGSAAKLAFRVLSREKHVDNCYKIRQQIRNLVPNNWTNAVYNYNGKTWAESTNSLISELKDCIKKTIPEASDDELLDLLKSDSWGFINQFDNGHSYHPRDIRRLECKRALGNYLTKNYSELDLTIGKFILSHLNDTSYLGV